MYFHRDERPASVPLWLESMALLEWMFLRASGVYYGCGVRRGDGSPVVVVPGFLGTDSYLFDLHWWLWRIGYRSYLSRIGQNAECLDILLERLRQTIDTAQQECGGKVHLIGHSLGGLLSRAAAARWPERVASVAALGSPFRGLNSHPLVMRMADQIRTRIRSARAGSVQPDCFTGYCDCDAVRALQSAPPPSVPRIAIYTRTDGVTDWRFCIDGDPDTDFEVGGTHVGLVFNAEVYRVLAAHLAAVDREAKAAAAPSSAAASEPGALDSAPRRRQRR